MCRYEDKEKKERVSEWKGKKIGREEDEDERKKVERRARRERMVIRENKGMREKGNGGEGGVVRVESLSYCYIIALNLP